MSDPTPRSPADRVLRCKSCNALLDRDSIDLDRGVATCPYCRAVMRIARRDGSRPADGPPRPRIALPKRFEIDDSGGEFRISYRWFSWIVLFLVPFTVFWCGFLVMWYGMAGAMDAPGLFKLFFLLFPLLHVGVGLGMAYFCAAMFLNRTTLLVRDGELTVSHGPLPWWGGDSYPTRDIEQLFCVEKITSSEEGKNVSYVLNAQLKGRGKKALLTGLHDADQALFLEQQLESHLKIEDRPVAGELLR